MLPVVIGSHPDSPWLADCLKSIPPHRPVKVHTAGGYEIAALRTGCATFDRFVFLQDSCEVLDPDFWNIVDTASTAWLFGGPPMYLGIYQREELEHAIRDAPTAMDKGSSILWEGELAKRLQFRTIWPEVTDATGRLRERHGRQNLVLENRYLRKWKGNWGQ